jgi:hypothetical protein
MILVPDYKGSNLAPIFYLFIFKIAKFALKCICQWPIKAIPALMSTSPLNHMTLLISYAKLITGRVHAGRVKWSECSWRTPTLQLYLLSSRNSYWILEHWVSLILVHLLLRIQIQLISFESGFSYLPWKKQTSEQTVLLTLRGAMMYT